MRSTCKMRGALRAWLLAIPLILGAAVAWADDARELLANSKQALAYSQGAIGRQIGNMLLTDATGRDLRLESLRGRPVILNFIYTSCGDICPIIIENVSHAVAQADKALGPGRFVVVTVGFDTRFDTPGRMRDFAHSHAINRPDWLFLSGDLETVARLAAETGFLFAARAGGFDHLSQTTILDGEGRVYRQVYGENFTLPSLVEPLKELVFGRPRAESVVMNLLNRVRLLCTIYDPAAGRYRFSYAIFIGIAIGAISLIAMAVAIARMWRNSRPIGGHGAGA